MLGSVQALGGESCNLNAIYIGDTLRNMEEVVMPLSSPLTKAACHATVYRRKRSGMWWWDCACHETGSTVSWSRAFRKAYRHVRLERLLDAVYEIEQEMERESDCE